MTQFKDEHSQSRSIDQSLAAPSRVCPSWLAKIIVIFVFAHLAAVLSEPLVFFSRTEVGTTAPEFSFLRRTLSPYVEWFYLDHGYFFFAPNPGPSHLVECTPKSADTETLPFIFPDRRTHYPRLLYHRYFMLAEFYNNRFAPPELSKEESLDDELVMRWKMDRGQYVSLRDSMVRSLSKSLQCDSVTLRRLERDLPSLKQILDDRLSLHDPKFLTKLPESQVDLQPLPAPSKSNLGPLNLGPLRGSAR